MNQLSLYLHIRICVFAIMIFAAASPKELAAQGDGIASIQQQLNSRIRVATLNADHTDIATAGDAVQVLKPGMVMYAVANPQPAGNMYESGKIELEEKKSGHGFLGVHAGGSGKGEKIARHTVAPEDKCWVTGIEVDKDGMVFVLYSEPVNGTRYYGSLKVPYPIRGSVPPVSVAMAAIGEVLAVAPVPAAPPVTAVEPVAAPQPPPAAEPVQADAAKDGGAKADGETKAPAVSIDEPEADVVAALGQPIKIRKVGTREIYTYKSEKVTFVNGKVTKVE
jgi:hypothetical protein